MTKPTQEQRVLLLKIRDALALGREKADWVAKESPFPHHATDVENIREAIKLLDDWIDGQ